MLASALPPPATVLSIGVITVSDQIDRRMLLRAAWLHKPWAGDGGPVAAHFVIRSGGAPLWLDEQLRSEETQHGDILRVPVPWDESRLKGPLLTLAAFITHEARRAAARYIAKVDDDANPNPNPRPRPNPNPNPDPNPNPTSPRWTTTRSCTWPTCSR